jgi:hypothetical protein
MKTAESKFNETIKSTLINGLVNEKVTIEDGIRPGDIDAWVMEGQEDGRVVVFDYKNPNDDRMSAQSSLGLFAQPGEPTYHWAVRPRARSDTQKPRVEVEYSDFVNPRKSMIESRFSTNPERTYKALTRLAYIHMNLLSDK